MLKELVLLIKPLAVLPSSQLSHKIVIILHFCHGLFFSPRFKVISLECIFNGGDSRRRGKPRRRTKHILASFDLQLGWFCFTDLATLALNKIYFFCVCEQTYFWVLLDFMLWNFWLYSPLSIFLGLPSCSRTWHLPHTLVMDGACGRLALEFCKSLADKISQICLWNDTEH